MVTTTENYSKTTMYSNKRKRIVDEDISSPEGQAYAPTDPAKRLKCSQSLIEGARKGDIKLCISAIRDGADVTFQSCGLSPLFYAAFYGHTMIIDYLVNCGADVDEKNPSGITPLSKAIEVGHMASVKCLLSHNADPNIADAKGIAPLMKAAKVGRLDLVMCLVTEGYAMLDYQNEEKNTALNEAALKGNTDIVKFLLENGASVDLPNSLGKTPLHRAVSASKAAVVKLLLEHGADVDAQDLYGFTAMHHASFQGALECAKILMEKKANMFIKDKSGKLPQEVAQGKRHYSIVDYFREVGEAANAMAAAGIAASL